MRIAFEATEAGFDADEYALVCGVSGADSAGTPHYLTFSRDAEENFEDWGVHVECDDQSNGDYGCVSGCRLSREALHVELSRQLGKLTGVEGFDIALQVDGAAFDSLRAGLQRVFRGMGGVLRLG